MQRGIPTGTTKESRFVSISAKELRLIADRMDQAMKDMKNGTKNSITYELTHDITLYCEQSIMTDASVQTEFKPLNEVEEAV